MLLLATRSPPLTEETVFQIAAVAGLSAADVRQRLSGSFPRVLAMAASGEPLDDMAPRLADLGLETLVCDPACAPSDTERLLPRALTFHPEALIVDDAQGTPHICPWGAIALIQRGVRLHVEVKATSTTQRRFSPVRALLTGGLSLSRKETRVENQVREQPERFVLLHRSDGQDDIMLYERRLHYQFLEDRMQASSFANLETVLQVVRTHAPTARVEDRVGRPGFVNALPKTATDPVDLALYLTQLAVARDA